MNKNIVIFGATGGTGKQLVKQSLEKGYSVSAFLRTPKKLGITDKNLTIIKGDVLNYSDVLKAVSNHDAVICSLGIPASDKSTLRTDGTTNIVKAMKEKGIKRFICQTSLGFGNSKEVLPWHMKYIIVPLILKNAFKDHELQESVIEKTKLDWTIVRPGNMTNGEITKTYKYGFKPTDKIKLKISRADVAHFMISQLKSNNHLHEKVGISY